MIDHWTLRPLPESEPPARPARDTAAAPAPAPPIDDLTLRSFAAEPGGPDIHPPEDRP